MKVDLFLAVLARTLFTEIFFQFLNVNKLELRHEWLTWVNKEKKKALNSSRRESNADLPMTPLAVTLMSWGRQSWKESWETPPDGTVIFSMITEFIFISHSEADFSLSTCRERPLVFFRSTLQSTARDSGKSYDPFSPKPEAKQDPSRHWRSFPLSYCHSWLL